MSFFDIFKKKSDYDFQFMDWGDHSTFATAPPILAKKIKPLREHQVNKFNDYHFPHCAGMLDYASMGYIIPAWANIWIKGNSADTSVFINLDRPENPRFPRANMDINLAPNKMNTKISNGFVKFDGVPENVIRLSAPWTLHSKPNMSFLLMPAYFHNPIFNNEIRGYPGIVDVSSSVNGFNTITFIFSIVQKFEYMISVGDPLIHVIPIQIKDECNGSYGFFSNEKEKRAATLGDSLKFKENFYRKFYMKQKKYLLNKRKEVTDIEKLI